MVGSPPALSDIWGWLESVPDPEIPVLSVIDLGIVRDIKCLNDTVHVKVTPTYSGCPATGVIAMEIETALRRNGIANVVIETQLSPPWTTDWLSDKGRRALQAYGIAPPQAAGIPKDCPHCGSDNLERISQFGSTPCKAQWRCKACLEPFDYFKCI